MENAGIFLDTCVILNRAFCADHEKRRGIENFLRERSKITSTYVCMELNRTFLADIETLRTYLYEGMNFEEIHERIENLDDSLNMKDRLRLLFQRITENTQSHYEAKRILERWIREYHANLLRGVVVIPSKTACEQGHYMPGYACRGGKSLCRVVVIIEKDKPLFEAVRATLVQQVKGDRQMLRMCWTLNEIINSPNKAKEDPRNCFDVGDVLIALDVSGNSTLVSGDKHFFLICDVLGVPFHYIDP